MSYKICTRCLMDTSAPNIKFNIDGVCNFCSDFLNNINREDTSDGIKLNELVDKIKKTGKGKKYDCIVGVSGGVDSSWTLVQVVKLGLRPLAVHMDNGWNSELAQHNINSLIEKLDVDFYTHVIDWEEYKNLMNAFFAADVVDVELLYDNAMQAVNYQLAKKFNIKYILAGTNKSTEGMAMPLNWNWYKRDKKNIISIMRASQIKSLNTFPAIGTIDFLIFKYFFNIKWLSFLDYTDYNKNIATDILKEEYNYKPYPYKHYESVFTRFYQGYLLPNKFNIDKRKLHLSNLVVTGQLNRNTAIQILEQEPYPDKNALNDDIDYFLNKMEWSKEKLQKYIKRPPVDHLKYGSEIGLRDFIKRIFQS